VLGYSPLEAGLWTAPSSFGFIAGAMLSSVLVRMVRPAFVVAGGLVVAAAGLALLAQVDSGSGVALVVVASVILSLGVAAPVTLLTDLIVGCVPPERAGVASGISETGTELGGALGIAVLGSIGVAVYRNELADAVPGGISREVSAASKETLSGAAEAVQTLPDALGTALLNAAQEAFTQGLQVAALTSAAVALGAAALVLALLRQMGVSERKEGVTTAVDEAAEIVQPGATPR
jgi:DHA2 family multidrug resistance protein-like MFS transporter